MRYLNNKNRRVDKQMRRFFYPKSVISTAIFVVDFVTT